MSIVKKIESWMPDGMVKCYRDTKWQIKHCVYERRYAYTIARLRKQKEPIRVVFFVIEASNWKYDYLYKSMAADPCFEVSVVVCERMNIADEEVRLETMRKCVAMCEKHGYRVYAGYDEKSENVFNPQTLRPDIIFYCNPYKIFYRDEFWMDCFKDSLICYSNYSYEIIPYKWAYTGILQDNAWRYYCESNGHQDVVSRFSPIKGKNTVATGYPMMDAYMHNTISGKEWKIQDKNIKRIIWAPHQSIYDAKMSNDAVEVHFSTFLLYADFMLELAEKYKDKIQVAFKPHPFLKKNLYEHSDWGKERTDAYYEKWAKGKNTCLVDGDYVNLFCSSDALIHDCGSFTAEYMCTGKPCMYLATYMNGDNMNEMGKGAFESHDHGLNKEDIDIFVSDIVIQGQDTMKLQRQSFYEANLLPPNGCSVAENIINDIKKALNK